MKKYIISIAFSITLAFLGISTAFAEKIIVGTEGTYAPYTYHDKKNKLVGFDVEVVQAVAAEIGAQIEFVEARWDALLAGLKTGRWDLVANQVWWNKKRDTDFTLSALYMKAGAAILVHTKSKAQRAEDLVGLKAAVSLTSAYRPLVEKLTKKIVTQDDFIVSTSLLLSKRVDFVVNDTDTIAQYLHKNPTLKVRAIAWKEAGTHDVVFALKKGNTALVKRINKALTKLEKNGTIMKIFKKYISR